MCQDCEIEIGTGFGSEPGSSTCSSCQADYFFRTQTEECEACVATYGGYDCSEAGLTTYNVPLKPGYFKLNASHDTPLVCPNSEWCIGGVIGAASICAEGHDSEFAFCSVCLPDYYKTIQSGCQKCMGAGAPEAIIVMIGGVFLAILVYNLFKCNFTTEEQIHIKTVTKIAFVCGQTLVKLPITFGIHFPAFFTSFLRFLSIPVFNRDQGGSTEKAPIISVK